MEKKYIICALIIVFIIVCVWHFDRCHKKDICKQQEGLNCDCARTRAADAAWDSGATPSGALRQCDPRFRGLMPYKHPSAPCARHVYNPFWPPFGAAGAYSSGQFTDVPISRMIGDHVPLE